VVNIVLNGTFYCSRAAGLRVIEKASGNILNIVAAYVWTGGPETVHSASAKGGVVAMTRTLEWAPYKIRVNAAAPGPVETEGAGGHLWPLLESREAMIRTIPGVRISDVREIANAAAYLVSDFAGFISGKVLDGGQGLGKGRFGR
jgi:NAD(P)-dependent dehydrogenase (short-subunit alcohol dehydrogenase family)